MDSWWGYAILFAAGLAAGAINVIAGGGSFLTLPVLILLGLPPTVANGTNRVGILLQNVGAVWSFRRHGYGQPRALLWGAVPACLGAVLGTWLALQIGDQAFRRVLAFFMVAITLFTLWDPVRPRSGETGPVRPALLVLGFFVAGIYGGFVQAGVGFLILTVTSLAGLDLVRGNAVKVLCILAFTILSLGMFASRGKVDWVVGGVLAAGTVLGGLLGVRLTVLKGHRWVKGFVTAAVIAFAIRMWWT